MVAELRNAKSFLHNDHESTVAVFERQKTKRPHTTTRAQSKIVLRSPISVKLSVAFEQLVQKAVVRNTSGLLARCQRFLGQCADS
jgi:hypothetical protein